MNSGGGMLNDADGCDIDIGWITIDIRQQLQRGGCGRTAFGLS